MLGGLLPVSVDKAFVRVVGWDNGEIAPCEAEPDAVAPEMADVGFFPDTDAAGAEIAVGAGEDEVGETEFDVVVGLANKCVEVGFCCCVPEIEPRVSCWLRPGRLTPDGAFAGSFATAADSSACAREQKAAVAIADPRFCRFSFEGLVSGCAHAWSFQIPFQTTLGSSDPSARLPREYARFFKYGITTDAVSW